MTHRRSISVLAVIAWFGLGTLAGSAAVAQPGACDRACLKGHVDQYLSALAKRDPSTLPVADSLKYTENGRVLELGEGFWKTAGAPLAYRDYVLDPQTGGVAVLTALREYDAITQTMVRLKIVSARIAEIETLVVRVGDQRWFAPENLGKFSDLFARTVPPAQQHTREELVAAADSYFTAVQTEGTPAFKQAPFAEGMKRIENGLQTTNVKVNPLMDRHTLSPAVQLERAFYKGTNVMNRRYPVVDTEHGTVLGIVAFRRDGAETPVLLLAEAFKVTGGQLQEIRAVMLNLPNGASTGWNSAE
jgi:hypothetical protein